jgi:hypothetical protein
MLFSERSGKKAVRNNLQLEGIDKRLQNKLWNILDIIVWSKITSTETGYGGGKYVKKEWMPLIRGIWHNYYCETVDKLSSDWSEAGEVIKQRFFANQWYEIYDFLEFIAGQKLPVKSTLFQLVCNKSLEEELSAYRFSDGLIVPIADQEEIDELNRITQPDFPCATARLHIETALRKLAERPHPDYGNCIKEAISAVEVVAKLICSDEKTTLGDALDQIERTGVIKLHKSLKEGFKKIYGYTGNADGIRHGAMDMPDLNLEDAQWMLVSCSAFVNYLVAKAKKAGIELR